MYRQSIADVLRTLGADAQSGLTTAKAQEKLRSDGYNELAKPPKVSLFRRFIDQFKDLMIIILLAAALVSFIADPKEWVDSLVILIVVILNAVLGVVMENQAEKSLEALENMSAPTTKVLRDGKVITVPARDLVKGDIMVIEAGDMIPADGRVVEAYNLHCDESSLTGESVPVEKTGDVIDHECVIGDQTNMVFASGVCTYGRGRAVVTATGMDNEVGKIAGLLMNQERELTPLQVRLNEIGKIIGIICLAICAIVFALETFSGLSVLDAFKTAVALAVAAVPEGLAATVTIVLSLSVRELVKRHAIIRRLPACETLGSTSIVCSDKTGTLTQNKMTVVKTYLDGGDVLDMTAGADEATKALLADFALCSDATLFVGDPTEIALVAAADQTGQTKEDLMNASPRVGELAFDSDRKMMSVVLKTKDGYVSVTKGGPDVILSRCDDVDVDQAMKANDIMARGALRVLAVATKEWDEMPEILDSDTLESHMHFVGFAGMIDPARPEACEAIHKAEDAGVRTIMITGDHQVTAAAIARDLGILHEGEKVISGEELNHMSQDELERDIETYSVYARVAPEHKMRIVRAWQKKGKIVAMTGDGVNDAPALKAADIGCAMGITGTDVAKNAATMVLTDDNFATIIAAIEQGRGIYDNIRKDVQFLLSSNVGEVLLVFVASLIALLFPALGFGVPLEPIHLLWVNLITDTLPAFALGLEPIERDVMKRKPRAKDESFFAGGLLQRIVLEGVMLGTLTLISYSLGSRVSHLYGMTMCFITLSAGELCHAFNMKSETQTIFSKDLFNNKYLWGSALFGAVLMITIIVSPLSAVFDLQSLDPVHLLEALALAFAVIPVVEIRKLIQRASH